jgi:hypothetical protein
MHPLMAPMSDPLKVKPSHATSHPGSSHRRPRDEPSPTHPENPTKKKARSTLAPVAEPSRVMEEVWRSSHYSPAFACFPQPRLPLAREQQVD